MTKLAKTFSEESGLDFTAAARRSMQMVVEDRLFRENGDARLIFQLLSQNFRAIPFCDYLKRYLYQRSGMTGPFDRVDVEEYRMMIRAAFAENDTPPSFRPTSAKLSALSKNWLMQSTVRREVVFLLGFGLRMTPDDVNDLLTTALQEGEIHPKNPFEVICWYCFRWGYGYPTFVRLMRQYRALPCAPAIGEDSWILRRQLTSVRSEDQLMAWLAQLPPDFAGGQTPLREFQRLFAGARQLTAELTAGGHHSPQQITAGDIERILCSALPRDRHGNVAPSKSSQLSHILGTKRFNRQRIHEVLSGNTAVDRFDLITLSFFLHSQPDGELARPKDRYARFLDSTNEILRRCAMADFCFANPYECFLAMCIQSDDPLGTYADVWEMGY